MLWGVSEIAKNWQTMLLAIALAMFTWFLVTGREIVETWVEMPVVMTNPSEGMIIEDGLVDKIQVRLRGPKGLVGSLATQNLTYSLDLSGLRIGQQVLDIEESKLPLTASYEVIEINPSRLKLTVDRRISKKIAVESAWAGELNQEYNLLDVVASPDIIEIRGPETLLRKITKTKVILEEDFSAEVPKSWVENVAVELPTEVEASPAQVRVEAFFGPKTRDIWVKTPLLAETSDGKPFDVEPKFVRLHIEGPRTLFADNKYRKDVAAKLVLFPETGLGKHELDYTVVLPEGCRLLKKNPDTVSVTVMHQ